MFDSQHSEKSDLIPPISLVHQIDFAGTRWLLVVEKEVSFLILQPYQDPQRLD